MEHWKYHWKVEQRLELNFGQWLDEELLELEHWKVSVELMVGLVEEWSMEHWKVSVEEWKVLEVVSVELMEEWSMEHWKVSVELNQGKLLRGVEVWALMEKEW